ncbi:MAG: hypothetical protein WBZ20_03575 [Nitrososphaeraceae archaeon]
MGNQEKRFEEGFNRDFSGPKPVETGKEYEIQITEISRKVYGIARVSKVGSTFATAEIV